MVVFDFDKTLTQKDTLLGFYRSTSKCIFTYYLKLPIYVMFAVIFKLKIINNNRFKDLGVKLFLWNKTRTENENAGKAYINKIQFNFVYFNDFITYNKSDVIIISASFREYLFPLFPDYLLLASKIKYNNKDKSIGIAENCYGRNKLKALKELGINEIEILFTDSYSDESLMEISKHVFLIKNNTKIALK